MNKPHKHAEVIKAWADGAEIEIYEASGWIQCDRPHWAEMSEYRVKQSREMRIAEAVKGVTYNAMRSFDLSPGRPSYQQLDIDLAAIIAAIKD